MNIEPAAIDKRLQAILERYQGSSNTMHGKHTGNDVDDTDDDESFIDKHDLHERVNDVIFQCGTCNWWCESHEQIVLEKETMCQECYDDENS